MKQTMQDNSNLGRLTGPVYNQCNERKNANNEKNLIMKFHTQDTNDNWKKEREKEERRGREGDRKFTHVMC